MRPDASHPPPAVRIDKPVDNALLIAPLAPVASLFGAAVGLRAAALNLRAMTRVSEDLAIAAALSYGQVSFLFATRAATLKAGPRWSLSRAGLEGGWITPNLQLGWGHVANDAGTTLAASPLIGAGLEAGWTWRWGRFVMQLGAGLAWSTLLGRGGPRPTERQSAWRPTFDWSLGYGW